MATVHKSTHKNAVRSRYMIKKAFAELLNEKDINKITVTDIVDRAGISRGTFYAHYMDVYDLYAAIQNNVMETVEAELTRVGAKNILIDPTKIIADSFAFLDRQKAYYKLFITSSRSDAIVKKIVAYVSEKFSAEIDLKFTEEERKISSCFICYSLGAFEQTVKAWLDEKLHVSASECAAMVSDAYLRSKPEFLSKLEPATENE